MTTDGPDPIEELRTLVNEPAQAPAAPPMTIVTVPAEKAPRMVTKPELPAYLVAALCIIGIVLLTLHGDEIPQTLNLVAMAALGGGVAITTPLGGGK